VRTVIGKAAAIAKVACTTLAITIQGLRTWWNQQVYEVDKAQIINLKSNHQVLNDHLAEEVDVREATRERRMIEPIEWLDSRSWIHLCPICRK
jgi:hypothetical protein